VDGWLAASLLSFGVIFVAELGDKSQLMALTFATRFRVLPVLVGITLATSLVHAVSVAVGYGLGAALPTRWILLAGGVAYLAFALWTLRGDELSDAEESRADRSTGSAVFAASFAFFLAELGDKTMLATITLASQHGWFGTWLGSTAGMVLADGLAIGVGRLLGRQLPERLVSRAAATLFVLFAASMLIDALGQFSGTPVWPAVAALLNHHVAGWIALGIGLLAVIAGLAVRVRAPRVPAMGAGPGPYRAPRRKPPTGRISGALLLLSVLLGLAAPLLVAADVLQPIPLLADPGWVVVGAGVLLLGVTLLLAAQVEVGLRRRYWRDTGIRPKLATRGMHGRVRNPGLTGLVLAMAGTLLMVPTLLAVLATVLLLVAVQIQVRAVLEPDLANRFGEAYLEYQGRTGRFLPRVR
jgi:putative Ca2+/H+ antiporter (TMEM165/GDT1 family)